MTTARIAGSVLFALGVLAAILVSPQADAVTRLSIVETVPASPATLGYFEKYYLLVRYETDEPIWIGTDAFVQGKQVNLIASQFRRVEKGTGEASLWFASQEPARIESIVIRAEKDAEVTGVRGVQHAGAELARAELAVDLAWTGQPATIVRPVPEWELREIAEMERSVKERVARMSQPTPWWGHVLIFFFLWVSPLLYLAVQLYALVRLRNSSGWFIAALLPLIPSVISMFFAAWSGPMPLSLPATGYLLILLGLWRLRKPPGKDVIPSARP